MMQCQQCGRQEGKCGICGHTHCHCSSERGKDLHNWPSPHPGLIKVRGIKLETCTLSSPHHSDGHPLSIQPLYWVHLINCPLMRKSNQPITWQKLPTGQQNGKEIADLLRISCTNISRVYRKFSEKEKISSQRHFSVHKCQRRRTRGQRKSNS